MDPARVGSEVPSAGSRARNLPLFAVLLLVFAAFVAYTIVVAVDHGVIGFIEATADNTAVMQVGLDLVIALVIALFFVRGDARRHDIPFAPYLVATVATGSIGLLAYMLHRTWRGAGGRAL